MKISFVVPVFNEEENISEFYQRLKQAIAANFVGFDYEIIFIDDGSQDSSFKLLEDLYSQDKNVRAIKFSRNFGHHIALTAGLDFAEGDFVVMMDADLQDKPEETIKLWDKLQEGYDVVYAQRINKKFSFWKKTTSRLFNWAINCLVDEKIVINSSIFRIMTRQVVENIRKLREGNRYIIGIIGWVGFKHAFQQVEHGQRFRGRTKYSLRKQSKLALNAIISFSTKPLKIIIKVGFLFVLVPLLLFIYALINKFIYHGSGIGGINAIILVIFIIGGIQMIVLGIVGEYAARAHTESKHRPLYIISQFLK